MSSKLFLLAISVLFVGQARAVASDPSNEFLSAEIRERKSCVIIFDLRGEKNVGHFGADCSERQTPCSTFKIPLALIAFNEHLLQDRNSSRKWDGHVTGNDGWDRDQTAVSWLGNSVVWFSRRLMTELGMKRVKDYLAKFHYGNEDMTGGLTEAWIDSSLRISPDEQIKLLRSIWKRELPLSKEAYDKAFDILPADNFQQGSLKGKTGSNGLYSEGKREQSYLGWYIGFYSVRDRDYAVVAKYEGPRKPGEPLRPGLIAEQILKSALKSSLPR